MGLAYRLVSLANDLLPLGMRRHIWQSQGPLMRGVRFAARRFESLVRDDSVYSDAYYEKYVDGPARLAAPAIVDSVLAEFEPKTVLDVGCGSGAVLAEFARRGVGACGLERAEAGLARCRQLGLEVEAFDLEQRTASERRADVVLSTEVAEHLPEKYADRFVELLSASAPVVVMTAATPGQGGTGHVNEQPNEYWIEKLARRGFEYRVTTTRAWRERWRERAVASWYANNVMVFVRTEPGSARA
jgi:cyclopropane fatty-acyl-phospholipid synthase-like methyltransferase